MKADPHLERRHAAGRTWRLLFLASTVVAVIALAALLYNIINESFGLVAVRNEVEPESLAAGGVPLERQSAEVLAGILRGHLSRGLVRRLESEQPLAERSQEALLALVLERVVQPTIVESWSLSETLLHRGRILREAAEQFPEARLQFRSWLNPRFLAVPQSSRPELAGVRTAILGSLWMILITVVVAFPLGVGAAIYLEEYARNNWLNRLIQVNIYNLAGVPSIIYGMLGLTIFVRALERFTSGAAFGSVDPTTAGGRTIISAGLTLALLVLPIVIINVQEAIRAVPNSLRWSSYGVGATKWQTIWHHVLPGSLDRILTGTILAVSRAIGETAPLVVVGASTFVAVDPGGPFSKFTALPIQIYQWTARPQAEFRNAAAAAIVVLLVMLLAMNAAAIVLRNRYRRQRSAA